MSRVANHDFTAGHDRVVVLMGNCENRAFVDVTLITDFLSNPRTNVSWQL